MSTSTQHFADSTHLHERRVQPRVLPNSLIYVAFGEANGGMVLNAHDNGFAISMAIPVGQESFSDLRVRMNGLSQSIEAQARMAWTSKSKKRAGIELLDVTASQREKIREWLSLEGVREVNFLPASAQENHLAAYEQEQADARFDASTREDVVAAEILSQVANANGSAADLPLARVTSPAVPASTPEYSLLNRFGGTAPESLGPAGPADFSFQNEVHTPEVSPTDDLRPVEFREGEWDLADITRIPRRKPRPEGMSVIALTLMWIAIPVIAIGMYAERRPIEQWLNHGDTYGKTISQNAPYATQPIGDQPEALMTGKVGPTEELAKPEDQILHQQLPGGLESVNHSAAATPYRYSPAGKSESQSVGIPSDNTSATNGGAQTTDSLGNVDTKLLNSLSFQEARARLDPAAPSAKNVSAKNTKLNSISKRDSDGSDTSHISGVPAQPPARSIAATNAEKPGNQTFSPAPLNEHVAQTVSVDSGFGSGASQKSSSPSDVSTASTKTKSSSNEISQSHSSSTFVKPSGIPPTNSVPPSAQMSGATDNPPTANTGMANGATINNANKPSGSVFNPSLSTSAAKPVSTMSSSAPMAPSSSPQPVVPNGSSSMDISSATTESRSNGVLMVARQGNETFLFHLPEESLTSGGATSIRMQRSIMVPPQSRWHRRGPIAKVSVGELLTRVAPDKGDAGVKPRVGDVVTVRAFVDKHGDVENLKPVSGRFALMPRIMRAVREWQYAPTLVDGKPVESEINVTIKFRQ